MRTHAVPLSAARRSCADDPSPQAFLLLRIGFTVAPILFGLDKFAERPHGRLDALPRARVQRPHPRQRRRRDAHRRRDRDRGRPRRRLRARATAPCSSPAGSPASSSTCCSSAATATSRCATSGSCSARSRSRAWPGRSSAARRPPSRASSSPAPAARCRPAGRKRERSTSSTCGCSAGSWGTPARPHADDELRLRPDPSSGSSGSMLAVPFSRSRRCRSKIDEQQPDLGLTSRLPERQEHAVAVVVREGDRVLVEHAHEARLAALVGAVRPALGVRRGEEEHVHALDERAVVVVDDVAQGHALEPVGEPPRVEARPAGAGCPRGRSRS